MPSPTKTIRQILAFARKNPGANTKKIISANKTIKERQSALNRVRDANKDLRNTEKLIGNAYNAYSSQLDFDPEWYYGYDYILGDRDVAFDDWTTKFIPKTQLKVYVPDIPPYYQPYRLSGFENRYKYEPIDLSRINIVPTKPLSLQPPQQFKLLKPRKQISGITTGGYYSPIEDELSYQRLLREETNDLDADRLAREIDDLPFKNGGKIHIKKENRGKFTDYCGGKVTSACIAKGKASSNPAIRKRATFAANARRWKHAQGGKIMPYWAYNIIHNDD